MSALQWQLRAAILLCGLVTWGCAAPLPSRPATDLPDAAELLSGAALFGEALVSEEPPDADIRGLDDEMRAFVANAVAGARSPDVRLDRLLRAMLRSGLFALDYQSEKTLTASETFHEGVGNCLAFTNLFVALAREARLQVEYQQVLLPAVWSGDAQMAILNQHVNVRVSNSADHSYLRYDMIVDFNQPEYSGKYPQRPLSDAHVDALFYSNLGAEAMRAGASREAFGYLAKALNTYRGAADAWTNLGVLYRRNDLPDHAESAFHQALRADPYHKSAMSNLVRLYEQQDQHSLAAAYRDRIRRHQERNPFHHLARAENAYAENRPQDALEAVDRAIRLRRDEHSFHYMRALILARIGRHDASRESLERARDYASVAQLRAAYEQKLNKLH